MVEVQFSTVEVDGVDEVLFVAEAAGRGFGPLDFGVKAFAQGVGNRVSDVRKRTPEPLLTHGLPSLFSVSEPARGDRFDGSQEQRGVANVMAESVASV